MTQLKVGGNAPGGKRKLLIISAALIAMALRPAIANAQSCYDLANEHDRLVSQAAQLLIDHPGVHAVAAACAATASNVYDNDRTKGMSDSDAENDAAASFVACAAAGCLFVGLDNCSDTLQRWFDIIQKQQHVEEEQRRQQCT